MKIIYDHDGKFDIDIYLKDEDLRDLDEIHHNFFRYLPFMQIEANIFPDIEMDGLEYLSYIFPEIEMDDWDFTDVNIAGSDFSEVLSLPKNLPQVVQDKNLNGVKFPCIDMEDWDFNGVSVCDSDFCSVLSLPNNFLQVIEHKDILYTTFPFGMDMKTFDFTDVDVMGADLSWVKALPDNFLQVIRRKSISEVKLPKIDMSLWDFRGVYIDEFTEIDRESILPTTEDFFKNIKTHHTECLLTENVIANIHLCDLNCGLEFNLQPYAEELTKTQLNIIRAKYPSLIGNKIYLPDDKDVSDS